MRVQQFQSMVRSAASAHRALVQRREPAPWQACPVCGTTRPYRLQDGRWRCRVRACGYTYGVRTGFDWRRGLGPFSVQTSVHTAATAESIADTLQEISALRGDRPATPQEMSLAQASLTRGYPRNFETTQQVARSVSQLALFDLPDSYFAEFVPKVNAVTAGEVTRVARTYLDPSRAIALVVGDRKATEESLDALGLGELHVLPPTG